MPTAVITGANRGIGFEFARQYRSEQWDVIAICRRPAESSRLLQLGAAVELLDVADPEAVSALGRRLVVKTIDVLVNNAGMHPGNPPFGSIDYTSWKATFGVNVIAPLQVAEAMVGAMGRGAVIANISSRQGSISDNVEGTRYLYRASKAALNAITRSMAIDLAGRGILTVALHPGWVKTDMGGTGADIDATESVSGMRRVIQSLTPERSGALINYDGARISW